MTPEDMETVTMFVISHDHAGMRKWLHGLPLDRVREIHRECGVGHPFSEMITDRYNLLLSEEAAEKPIQATEHWYKKPVGVFAIGITVAVVGRIAYSAVIHFNPGFFK